MRDNAGQRCEVSRIDRCSPVAVHEFAELTGARRKRFAQFAAKIVVASDDEHPTMQGIAIHPFPSAGHEIRHWLFGGFRSTVK